MRARFAVDTDLCIGCGLCHERAPENLDVPPGSMHAVVVKQPETEAEEAACSEASDYCPTGGLQRLDSAAAAEPVEPLAAAAELCGSP